MNDKVAAAIKAKYPALNIRKTRLDEISARIAAKITDESEIDAKVEEFDSYFPFADIAKNDDALAEAQRKVKTPTPKPEPTPTPEPAPDPKPDDTPEWAKALIGEVQALKSEKIVNTRKAAYAQLFDGKDEKVKEREMAKFDRMNFESDEVFSEFIEAEKAAIADQAKDSLKTSGTFKSVSAPSDKPSDDEIDAIVNDMKI